MSSIVFRSGLAALTASLLLSAVVVATAKAQSGPSTPAPGLVSFIETQKGGEHNVGDLIGASVVTPAGEIIGDVNYLLVEDDRIKTAVIGIGGMLGMGEKNVAVAFADLKPAATNPNEKRRFTLSTTSEAIARAPAFQWSEKPLAVRVEDSVKSAAQKVKETAKDLGDKASEAMKGSTNKDGTSTEPKKQP